MLGPTIKVVIDVSSLISWEKTNMICVVLLQNCVDCVEYDIGYCSETCVTCDVDGTEEVISIKVEETIYIRDGIPESIPVPLIKTEHEVRVWDVCEVVAADAFWPFIGPKRKL
jgi:hypothetical protein